MPKFAKISSEGQVIIPTDVRKKLYFVTGVYEATVKRLQALNSMFISDDILAWLYELDR